MYVGADHNLADDLRDSLEPYGSGLVHYQNPIKALDNIAEIMPQAILYSQQDFPRHWKIMVRLVREDFTREECVFVLFNRVASSMEEAEKALYLEINAILNAEKGPKDLFRQFQDVYLRYRSFPVLPGQVMSDGNKAGFNLVFRHPRTHQMISGILTRLEKDGGIFKPDFRQSINDIAVSDLLNPCTIKVSGQILNWSARVMRNTGQLVLEWEDLTREDQQVIQLLRESSRQ